MNNKLLNLMRIIKLLNKTNKVEYKHKKLNQNNKLL